MALISTSLKSFEMAVLCIHHFFQSLNRDQIRPPLLVSWGCELKTYLLHCAPNLYLDVLCASDFLPGCQLSNSIQRSYDLICSCFFSSVLPIGSYVLIVYLLWFYFFLLLLIYLFCNLCIYLFILLLIYLFSILFIYVLLLHLSFISIPH